MATDPSRIVINAPGGTTTVDAASFDEGLRRFMVRTYNYMLLAMLVCAASAYALATVEPLARLFFNLQPTPAGYALVGYSPLGWITVFGTIGLLFFSRGIMHRGSVAMAQTLFWVLAAGIGVSVGATAMIYTGESVMRVFLITAATFGAVSLYGYTTKRSLAKFGAIAGVGALVLLVASVINIMLGSTMLMTAIAGIGVLIAVVMIAANTQMLKETYAESLTQEASEKTAIFGALGLFVWFVNLFQFLMFFLGQRE